MGLPSHIMRAVVGYRITGTRWATGQLTDLFTLVACPDPQELRLLNRAPAW